MDPELSAAANSASESLQALSGILGTSKQKDALASLDNATGVKNFSAKLNIATTLAKGLGKVVGEYTSAMYQGKKGLSAMNDSIDAAAGATAAVVTAAGALLGPLGFIAGLIGGNLVKGVAEYTKAVNEQTDALFKAYQSLSEAGAVGSEGLQGVYSDMQKLGLGVQDLDKMVTLINTNAGDLALFGGSVREGRRQFADISEAMDKHKVEMFNLGMSQDELNEATMSYIRLQSKMGTIQNRTANEVAEEARKYILEQDAVTKLTGMSRKEQEDILENVRSQEMFRSKLEELRAQGRDAEAKELQKTHTIIASVNKQAAQGFADLASGNMRTQAAQQAMRASHGEDMRVINAISSGGMKAAQAADRVFEVHGKTAKEMGGVLAKTNMYGKIYGNYADDLNMHAKRQSGALTTIIEGIEEDQKAQKEGADKELDRRSKLEKDQQEQMKQAQNLVRMGKGMTAITTGFSDALKYSTELLSKPLTKGTGAAPAGYGTPAAVAPGPQLPARPPAAAPTAAPVAPVVTPVVPTPVGQQPVKDVTADLMSMTKDDPRIQRNRDINELAKTIYARMVTERGDPMDRRQQQMWLEISRIKAEAQIAQRPQTAPTTAPAVTPAPTAPQEPPAAPVEKPSRVGARTGRGITDEEALRAARKMDSGVAPAAAPVATPAAPAAEPVAQAPVNIDKLLTFTGNTGSRQNFNELNQSFADAVLRAAAEYNTQTGRKLTVNSAKRDPADQQRLYNETVAAGRPGIGPNGMPVGKPGRSPHETGAAIDIQQGKGDQDAIAALRNAGLQQTVPKDPVHFQAVSAAEGGVFQGPEEGYPATLHGEELVAPLDNSSDFMQAITGLSTLSEQTLIALKDIIKYQQENVNIREKMLRLTQ